MVFFRKLGSRISQYIGNAPGNQETTRTRPEAERVRRKDQGEALAHYGLIISLVALIIPQLLYLFRHLDDNRLTSWEWVFADRSPVLFLLAMLGAVLLANFLARRDLFAVRRWMLFGFAFAVGMSFWGQPEVIVDASRYFSQAKHLALFGPADFWAQWGREIFAWTDLPLVPFLYGLLFYLFGEERLIIQVVNTLFFAGTVMLIQTLGSKWWGRQAGACAGLLLLAFPYLLTQVPLIMVDIHVMFFLVLAIFSLEEALEKGGVARSAAAALALFFLFAVKFSAWLFLSVALVITLVCMVLHGWQTAVRRAGLVGLIAGAAMAVFFFSQFEVVASQLAFLADFQKPGLNRWVETYLSTFFFQVHPFVTIAAGFSLIPAWRRKDPRFLTAGFLILLLLILQIQRIRYTLPVFPLLALLAAGSISSLPIREELKRLIVLCAVLTSLVLAQWGFLPFLKSMSAVNFIQAGRFLDSLPISRAYVATLNEEDQPMSPVIFLPLLDIHTSRDLRRFPLPEPVVDPESYRTSSLRFTWEFTIPSFYQQGEPEPGTALVVVSGLENPVLPPELQAIALRYPQKRKFAVTTGIFWSQTLVDVYHY